MTTPEYMVREELQREKCCWGGREGGHGNLRRGWKKGKEVDGRGYARKR